MPPRCTRYASLLPPRAFASGRPSGKNSAFLSVQPVAPAAFSRFPLDSKFAMSVIIKEEDLVQSIADGIQFISYYHPVDYIRHLARAYEREESPPRATRWRRS